MLLLVADAVRSCSACWALAYRSWQPVQQPVTTGRGSTAAGVQQEGQAVGSRYGILMGDTDIVCKLMLLHDAAQPL